MSSILGYAELLRDEVDAPDALEYLQCIQESGQLLLAIINDILDLSKIEAGKLDLHPAPFEISELVDRVRRRFIPQADQKKIRLHTEISPGTIPRMAADPRRLEQVLGNLVSNAIKFTSRGSVTLSISSETTPGEEILLKCTVRDTGIGIPQKELDRLFQPFTQLDSSIARKYSGSGLGLAIAKTLCARMGGNLTVRSAEGVGSVFIATIRVSLPASMPIGPEEFPSDATRLAGRRVLVVDDHRINRRLLATILEKWSVEVASAENGEEALEKVRRSEFDAILMDVQMPGLDGFETTRRIRTYESGHPGRKPCRIIAVTAFAMVGDEQKCFEAGMDNYVGKPLNIAELVRALG
jgi:CheY-like chemotaxis protein/two-component sensor histidine kinase